jgi:CelD/BcsL family acetyltransferase involved in cellulose biosynthesis
MNATRGFCIGVRSAVDEAAWEELLRVDPRATPFQRPSWLLRYARFHPRAVVRFLEARDGDGRLAAGLGYAEVRRAGVRAMASGVAGTYGGPVSRPGASEAERALWADYLHRGGPRVVRRELLWGHREPPAGGERAMKRIDASLIDLSQGFDHFWMHQFPKNRRNECNRSERRGLAVEQSADVSDLERFAPLYREMSGRWGIAPESSEWLSAVLLEEPSVRMFVARRDGELMGAHICVEMRDEIFVWIGTTARSREVFPSALLIREEVRFACGRGLRWLNLGSSLRLPGVAQYKRLLGASPGQRWLLLNEAAPLRWWTRLRRGRVPPAEEEPG